MRSLAWEMVKARKVAFVGAFIAILLGTAVVAACGVLMESGIRSGVPTERYAAVPVVVGGQQVVQPEGADFLEAQQLGSPPAVPVELAERIAAVPGVARVVGETSFPARAVTADGGVVEALGHNWDAAVLTPMTVREGRAPSAAGEVVVDAGLAARAGVSVGDALPVMTTSTPMEYRVVGVAGGALAKQSGLYFTSPLAESLSGTPGRVHAFGVFVRDGVDAGEVAERVERALAGEAVTVAVGGDRGGVEFAEVGRSRVLLLAIAGSFAGIALLVAVFVVAGTLALAINQRRRELALLRAIAATPRQIVRLIGRETTVVATMAAGLGAAAGVRVAGWLRDGFAAIRVIPDDLALAVGPAPLVAAFLLGVGAARLAAWVSARRPARIPPTEALAEAAVEPRELGRWRVVAGTAFLAGGAALALVPLFTRGPAAVAMTSMSVLVAVIGTALLGPRAVRPLVRLASAPLERLGVGGYLAAHTGRANARRLSSALTPLMLSIAFAVVNFHSQTAVEAATRAELAAATTADHVLSAPGGLSPEVAAAARGVPGVDGATAVVRTNVVVTSTFGEDVRVERAPALGVDDVRGTLDLGVVSGSLDDLRGETVALDDETASGRTIGDEVELHLDDGTVARLRLVATFERGMAFGGHVLPADLARAHTAARTDTAVLVRLSPDADRPATARALAALADRFPGLTVGDRSALTAPDGGDRSMQFWVNLMAVGVILGYIAISVANTLVLGTAQRRREFALLRLIGATRRQVLRAMRAEALLVVAIAVGVGTLLPAVPLALLGIGLMGDPLPTGSPWVYLGIVGFTALLGLLALTIPTRLALRTRPVEAIGLRE
ncbi:FtsX-like permease family protein [Actinokineospora sp. UTMC 2448]|uniref:ABC transporter permease n=1 Tax=Actinokineospora sp. UTMC 2448 TaxID=2268449 RepID=UPI00216463CC|nr:FtsX-like permease family protein [Actinokineospora sp. UTMC 2448]UVS79681.1 acidobacterial duplicated orphan permease [Actinokineospora sp. UTMC 2448]